MNILWITTDQQQWQTIAGRSACRMPNVQRLIDNGMLFNRAYAPMPVCCPVRAMWMSGAYPWHNGVHTQVHSAPSLTLDMYETTVGYSERLKEAGYQQGFVGKWHASNSQTPLDYGFDEIAMPLGYGPGVLDGVEITPPLRSTDTPPYACTKEFSWPGSEPFNMWGHTSGPIEQLRPTQFADAAIAMMERYSKDSRPWHIAVHFQEPHDPYEPHEDYLKRYDAESLPVPESFHDSFEGKPGMHKREADSWGTFTEADVQQGMAHYFAYCEQLDDQIGRILDTLDACGQTDDTMIVFTSDHGDLLGAHRMWIKSWMSYEEVYRMPLVIRFPEGKPGVCDHLVQTHDIPHTFLDMLGLPPLPHPDGRSLQPLLKNPMADDWKDEILCVGYGCEFFVTQRMIITERYKYVFNGFDIDEMYDLENDPCEMTNVIDSADHAAARSELRGKLYDLMNQFEDPYGDTGGAGNRYGAPRYLPRS